MRGRGRGASGASKKRGRARGRGRGRSRGGSNAQATIRPPPPYRPSSKNTPPVITFESRHPFTEEVGPTQLLPESATALDFLCKCLMKTSCNTS